MLKIVVIYFCKFGKRRLLENGLRVETGNFGDQTKLRYFPHDNRLVDSSITSIPNLTTRIAKKV